MSCLSIYIPTLNSWFTKSIFDSKKVMHVLHDGWWRIHKLCSMFLLFTTLVPSWILCSLLVLCIIVTYECYIHDDILCGELLMIIHCTASAERKLAGNQATCIGILCLLDDSFFDFLIYFLSIKMQLTNFYTHSTWL